MMFNFFVNQHLFYALATGDATPLIESLEQTKNLTLSSQWVQFLRNHDEKNLGRVSKKDRQKAFDRMGPDENMQLYKMGVYAAGWHPC